MQFSKGRNIWQVYNAYQALLNGLGTMLQVCHSSNATAVTTTTDTFHNDYVRCLDILFLFLFQLINLQTKQKQKIRMIAW